MHCFVHWLAGAGQYNNEYLIITRPISNSIGATGLYRITQPMLATLGIQGAPADQFQLWRNGVEVPIYTSVPAGTLGAADYIEFWGFMNDGKPDTKLYSNPTFQMSDQLSLTTDTAAFFLTVNPAGGNQRTTAAVNNVAGNILPPEPYFMSEEKLPLAGEWRTCWK
jgi:hypothetical protein